MNIFAFHMRSYVYYLTTLSTERVGWCEAWSLTMREERRLRVFENRVLRRIFGPKRDEVTREWRKLHNDELNHLYSSPNSVRVIKSRIMRWAGYVARMGERRGVYKALQVLVKVVHEVPHAWMLPRQQSG